MDCSPHFEKMLYDNAQLARVYLHAWQVTGNEFFRTITEEILDYVIRDMLDPAGGFYSTQDADSEGEEGKFFVWTPDEIREVLGDEAAAFMAAYGVTQHGNFEAQVPGGPGSKDILEYKGHLSQRDEFAEARQKLFATREQRVHPGRDEKILTAWNGLMLAAFAEAARLLDRDDYREVAERNAAFLLRELRQKNGRLLRTWKRRPDPVREGPGEGAGEAKLNGYLEGYSYLIEGLLELYQTRFDPQWYLTAQELAETMITHFSASDRVQLARTGQLPSNAAGLAGFYDTSDDHEALITRPRDLQDNATPSGNAMAVTALLKLAGLAEEPRYLELAHDSLAQTQPRAAQYPLGFGQWLVALDYALSHPAEIAVVGPSSDEATQQLLRAALSGFRPHQIIACGPAGISAVAVPLLADRHLVDGKPAAYVCRDFVCHKPVAEPRALRELLESKASVPARR